MKLYTVHLRRGGLDPDRDIAVIKEGFSWPACILSLIWALWHRLWWVAAGLIALSLTIEGALWALGIDETLGFVIGVSVAVLTGLLANDLHRWTLERDGFIERGMVSGDNAEEALIRFLDQSPDVAGGMV